MIAWYGFNFHVRQEHGPNRLGMFREFSNLICADKLHFSRVDARFIPSERAVCSIAHSVECRRKIGNCFGAGQAAESDMGPWRLAESDDAAFRPPCQQAEELQGRERVDVWVRIDHQ